MAPRKEKAEKTSAEDGTNMVLGYLKRQNRPYSAIDVSNNLHNKVTKAQSAKILKELHEKNQIIAKAAGKQVVYHALQPEPSDSTSPEAMASLDVEITVLREETLPALQNEEKVLRTQLNALNASMSLQDLRTNLEQSRQTKFQLEQRLEPLRQGTVKLVSEKEREEVEDALNVWTKRAKARRKICKELWVLVWLAEKETANRGEGDKTDVWEELGCEGPLP